MYRQALALNERVLGPEHPHTFIFLNNLACVVEKLGRLEDAALLYKQLWDVRAKVLGLDAAQTLAAKRCYARCSKAG